MDVDPPAAEGDDPKPKQKSLELFEDFCTFAFVMSFVMAVGGIACIWLVPDDYNLGQVLNVSLQFFEAQVGVSLVGGVTRVKVSLVPGWCLMMTVWAMCSVCHWSSSRHR
jgi:hypothetical protein